jgi:hypothetical protein
MPNKKKKKPGPKPGSNSSARPGAKRGPYKKRKDVAGEMELLTPDGLPAFTIETGVPIAYFGGKKNPNYERVKKLMAAMEVKQSVVLPRTCKNVPAAVVKQEGWNKSFRMVKLPVGQDNDPADAEKTFFRLWRMA